MEDITEDIFQSKFKLCSNTWRFKATQKGVFGYGATWLPVSFRRRNKEEGDEKGNSGWSLLISYKGRGKDEEKG